MTVKRATPRPLGVNRSSGSAARFPAKVMVLSAVQPEALTSSVVTSLRAQYAQSAREAAK